MYTTQCLHKSATAATVAATPDRYRYRCLQLVNTCPNTYDGIDTKKSATAATVALKIDIDTDIGDL